MEIPYWTSDATIKDKDEERTEKVLKEQGDDNITHIIDSHDSITSTLKMIYWILIFSTIVNMFTAGLLIYILYRLFGR